MTRLVALLALTTLLFSNTAFAASQKQDTSSQPSADTLSIYTKDELNQLRKIHTEVVNDGLCTLNSDGTITINTDANTLSVNEDTFNEYLQSVENLNNIIELGVVSIDKHFNIDVKSTTETTKIVYERDKKLHKDNAKTNNKFDTQSASSTIDALADIVSVFNSNTSTLCANKITSSTTNPIDNLSFKNALVTSSALPTLYAYATAKNNVTTLKNYYSTMLIYYPSQAFGCTQGWWIAKVCPGGDWDYKSVSGYSPYSKQWSAVQRYTTSTKTSEWFGNYNYGFTGRSLYSLTSLLAASNGVSILTGGALDDPQDTIDVTQGYNEAA